jgi:multicomponent Na+:H+ antiporter subunit D
MAFAAVLCVFIGSYPWVLYSLLPFPVEYAPYTSTHVIAQLQLLFFSALAFTWLKLTGLYPPELRSVNIDAEWVYRRLGPRIMRAARSLGSPVDARMRKGVLRRIDTVIGALFRFHGPRGILARTWETGSTVLWVAVLLWIYLLLYFAG